MTPLLDVAGAAEVLGTTVSHVRALVYRREIPFVHVGRLVRFKPDQLEQWIEDNTTYPGT